MMSNKIDYTPYYLDALNKLKEVHDLLKKNAFEEAATKLDESMVELRMMRIAVKSHVE